MLGEDFRIALVATSREQATLLLRFIKRSLKQSPMLAEQIVSETADSITLVGGCQIVASVCSARAHRGCPNALVIIDEAAHYVETEGDMSLSSLLDALRPSQAQFGELALLLAISTPLDANGAFYELDRQAATGKFSDIAALHLPTIIAKPDLELEVERARLWNPRSYEREYMGNYASGEESLPHTLPQPQAIRATRAPAQRLSALAGLCSAAERGCIYPLQRAVERGNRARGVAATRQLGGPQTGWPAHWR
jgi:hypothetical protein